MGDYDLTHKEYCSDPALKRYLVEYCFNDITEKQKRLFEAHLLDCDSCWEEVKRLHEAVEALRSDKSALKSITSAQLATAFGTSSEAFFSYAGHRLHIYVASGLYALNFIAILFLEIAYQFDRLGLTASVIALLLFVFVFGTSTWALARGATAGARAKPGSGWNSVILFFASAIVIFGGLCLFLPNYPVTLKVTQGYTVQIDYLKDLFYLVPVAVAFLVLPFHFIVAMQRELAEGKRAAALHLLSGEKWAVPPRGVIYPRSNLLWIAFFGIVMFSFGLTWRLLDVLQPALYSHLYTILVFVRLALYFGLWFECLCWYGSMLNEIKRECLAVERVNQRS